MPWSSRVLVLNDVTKLISAITEAKRSKQSILLNANHFSQG